MKKMFFLKLLLLSLFFQSCNNDIENSVNSKMIFTKKLDNEVEVEVVNDGKTLRFKNREIFEKYEYMLKTSSEQKRLEFADSLGFNTLFKIRHIADKELEQIVDKSLSVDEFQFLYRKYKMKYQSIFAFNISESEELFPYVLLDDPYSEFYVGIGGNVIIGDKDSVIYKQPTIELYKKKRKEMEILSLSREIPVNDHGVQVDKRKVGLHMYSAYLKKPGDTVYRQYVDANFTAQKKNMFGWVRYSTVYFCKFSLGNFYFQHKLPNGQLGTSYFPAGNEFYFTTGNEQSGNCTMILGYGDGIGHATFWSRGVPEDKAGYMHVALPRK